MNEMKRLQRVILGIGILLVFGMLMGCTGHIEKSGITGVELVNTTTESKETNSTDAEPMDITTESEETEESGTASEASDTEPVDRMLSPEEFMQQYGIPQDTEYEIHDVYDGEGFLLSRSVCGEYTDSEGIYKKDYTWYSYAYKYQGNLVISKSYMIFMDAVTVRGGYTLNPKRDRIVYEYDGIDRMQADIARIDERWIQLVEENVPLSEDEAYERFEWIKGRTDCLRVWIQFKDEPVRDHFWHKSDYFLFVTEDGEVYDKLYVDYDITHEKDGSEWAYTDSLLVRRSAGSGAAFSAHFEDVTGDGHEDLLVDLDVDSRGDYQCCVYVYQEGTYVYIPGFEDVWSPYVDENGVLWSVCSGAQNTVNETQYAYQNGEFIPIRSQTFKWWSETAGYIPVVWSYEEEAYVPADDPTIRSCFDRSKDSN